MRENRQFLFRFCRIARLFPNPGHNRSKEVAKPEILGKCDASLAA